MSDEVIPERLREVALYGWIGEDELGSGQIGLKAAQVPAGIIAIVATDFVKVSRLAICDAMEAQALQYGKKIFLCRWQLVEVMDSTASGVEP